jgi:hypothetical protein
MVAEIPLHPPEVRQRETNLPPPLRDITILRQLVPAERV